MRKLTVCLTDEQQKEILEIRKTDEYCRCSLSEIARNMIDRGVKSYLEEKKKRQQYA